MNETSESVLNFWFHELGPDEWFKKDDRLDELIRSRFSAVHKKASSCELFLWRVSAPGRLAEIIVLDQFSRNIYRGTPSAFSNDSTAVVLSQELITLKLDQELSQDEKIFAYMPFMHSESRAVHEAAMPLFQNLKHESTLQYELLHKNIIDKFGRFPHRNKILGRTTTPLEEEFLKTNPGF